MLLHRLADDREALRRLVSNTRQDDNLLALAEKHLLFDYIVLMDRPTFRLRLHLARNRVPDVLHDHRHSFSTLVLHGQYDHQVYAPVGTAEGEQANSADTTLTQLTTIDAFELLTTRTESAGSSYSLHHSSIHTTDFAPGTATLFIRGPNVKSRSFILDSSSGSVTWRLGASQELKSETEARRMTQREFDQFVGELEDVGIL